MRGNNLIKVFYHKEKVGQVALTKDRLCAFEYNSWWLANGFSISPFKLPLEKRVFVAKRDPFNGNFGVFEDSLPDGWGALLIDRMLRKNDINPLELSLLDRLAIVGSSAMGALEYQPEAKLSFETGSNNLDYLAAECEKILNGEFSDSLDELVNKGGFSGGARPKVLIKHKDEDWIVKFKSSQDPTDIGKQEYETSLKAKEFGLSMSQTKLFEGKYFGTKRFDRKEGGEKIHMLSVSGALDASHRYPSLDYIDLLNATMLLTRDYREVEKLFRQMCFNIYISNRDDHAKNFSFLFENGVWKVSPPYDLVRSDGPGGEHTTSIAGEGKNPTEKDILKVAKATGIKIDVAKAIINEINNLN
jgi:serine/threonine-protein kinase HipA